MQAFKIEITQKITRTQWAFAETADEVFSRYQTTANNVTIVRTCPTNITVTICDREVDYTAEYNDETEYIETNERVLGTCNTMAEAKAIGDAELQRLTPPEGLKYPPRWNDYFGDAISELPVISLSCNKLIRAQISAVEPTT